MADKDINSRLYDDLVTHQVGLMRLAPPIRGRVINILEDARDELAAAITARMRAARAIRRAGGAVVDVDTTNRLREELAIVSSLIQSLWANIDSSLADDLTSVSLYEADFQQRLLRGTVPINYSWVKPSPDQLETLVTELPFLGKKLGDHMTEAADRQFNAILKSIQTGVVQGQTLDQIVKASVGTAKAKFTDGIILDGRTRNGIEAMVRAGVNHSATTARERMYSENTDLIKGVILVATLDSRTTIICRNYDGTRWPVNQGPRPPFHLGCRTVTAPILRGFDELIPELKGQIADVPAVRASMTGEVPASATGEAWLRAQSIETQNFALGRARAQLFRANPDADLSQFLSQGGARGLSLSELAIKEPDLFKSLPRNQLIEMSPWIGQDRVKDFIRFAGPSRSERQDIAARAVITRRTKKILGTRTSAIGDRKTAVDRWPVLAGEYDIEGQRALATALEVNDYQIRTGRSVTKTIRDRSAGVYRRVFWHRLAQVSDAAGDDRTFAAIAQDAESHGRTAVRLLIEGDAPRPGLKGSVPGSGAASSPDLEVLVQQKIRRFGTSRAMHQGAAGTYRREAAERHVRIMSEMFEGVRSGEPKVLRLFTGGPASGKSVLFDATDRKGVLRISNDWVKERLPDYHQGYGSTFVHDEATDVINRAFKSGITRDVSEIHLETVGDRGFESFARKIRDARAAGYRIKVEAITLDPDEAVKRASVRQAETGRMVPESVIRGMHRDVSQVMPRILSEDLVDEFDLRLNTGGSAASPEMKLVASLRDGLLEIKDRKAWASYLAQGGDDAVRAGLRLEVNSASRAQINELLEWKTPSGRTPNRWARELLEGEGDAGKARWSEIESNLKSEMQSEVERLVAGGRSIDEAVSVARSNIAVPAFKEAFEEAKQLVATRVARDALDVSGLPFETRKWLVPGDLDVLDDAIKKVSGHLHRTGSGGTSSGLTAVREDLLKAAKFNRIAAEDRLGSHAQKVITDLGGDVSKVLPQLDNLTDEGLRFFGPLRSGDDDDLDGFLSFLEGRIADTDRQARDKATTALANFESDLGGLALQSTKRIESREAIEKLLIPDEEILIRQGKAEARFSAAVKSANYTDLKKTVSQAGWPTAHAKKDELVQLLLADTVEARDKLISALTLKSKEIAAKAAATKKIKAKAQAEDILPIEEFDGTGWSRVGTQLGSNPGGTFEDAGGVKWYVKFAKDDDPGKGYSADDRLLYELIANRMYQVNGIKVPEIHYVRFPDGRLGLASKVIEGNTGSVASVLRSSDDVLDGFIYDAWLGNWDVVGAAYDNILAARSGAFYRIDTGGSLAFRAQGALKGTSNWTNDVKELKSLLDPKLNPRTSEVFSAVSHSRLIEQLEIFQARVTDEFIDSIIDEFVQARGSVTKATLLRKKLKARRDSILEQTKDLREQPAIGSFDAGRARSFTTAVDGEQWLDSTPMGGWYKSIPRDQADAVRHFTNGGASSDNSFLWRSQGSELIRKGSRIDLIDQALDTDLAVAAEDLFLWRGLRPEDKIFKAAHEFIRKGVASADPTGKIFDVYGFSSTSIARETAFKHDVQIKIRVPKGFRGVGWAKPISHHTSEYEVVLRRNIQYRVIRVERSGKSILVEVEIVGLLPL